MRVVSVSYNSKNDQPDPEAWLKRIDFYIGILESLALKAEVINIDLINREGQLHLNGVQHIFADKRLTPYQVNRIVKQLQPDIVLVQGFHFPLAVIHLGMICKARIVLHHHAEKPPEGLKAKLFQLGGRFADQYFFAAKSVANEWSGKKLLSNKKVAILPEASSVFSKQDAINEPDCFLWVGRLNENKDPLTVIKAFAEFRKQYAQVKLFMIFQSDELLAEVRQQIEQLDIIDSILLIGKVERLAMQQWYEKAGFVISSSHYEGCSISVIEAMSCGCIPVVTNIPSFDLHTDNGRIGFTFQAGDVNDLSAALVKTRERDVEDEKSKVIAYYHSELSFSAIAEKMYAAFERLVNQ